MGGLVLFSYGYLVNSPPWDFGRLLGVYIVCFFVVGVGVAAGSFGLFGCMCTDGFKRREKPAEDGPETPKEVGEMPPLPTPPK